ncbi:MAG TPA: PQQ-dependent sugar dehydrogenase [Methylomirabilota bacterium]|jgi:glucose/arabinose dehydrogenase|nr:PQQ-dependent sugar dehydrogenase [Methylomirabilota bacterium]
MRPVSQLSLVVVLALALVSSAMAQAPPPWKQGQPTDLADSTLAPIAQPPGPAAPGEIRVDKIKVPRGFTVSLWAHGINNARAMVWGDKGTLFVSSRVAGNVYAVLDRGDRREVKVIAKGLNLPNGVAFKDGTLYVAEISRISKLPGIEAKLDNPPALETVYDILPRDLPHGWKYLAFGPDGKLYFNIGAPCNICQPPDTHANISRVNVDGTGFEYVAHGVRNSVGFDWHPVTKELYFTTHGRDWLGDDAPSDRLDVAARKGLHFGFPYCHQGDIPDPDFAQGRSCGEFAPPLLKTGAHVAGNGVQFYTGSMFPPEYRNRIFLAQRGSWNRSEKVGFRIMMVTLRPRDVPKYEVFAEGWLQGDQIWGRPVYTQQMKDGSLLIADDYAGAIYRVAYKP